MPGKDDIKFGIVLEVKGGRKAAGELRLPQQEARKLGRALGGSAGAARRYETASRRVERANQQAARSFSAVHGRGFPRTRGDRPLAHLWVATCLAVPPHTRG